jgi:DNA ligase-1
MKSFALLYTQLDQTTKTLGKIKALVQYFETASEEDKLWAVALLSHRRPKRTVNTNFLRDWAAELAQIPLWLFEESYHVVGDLAETISLVLPKAETSSDESLVWWINFIRDLEPLSVEEKKEKIIWSWRQLEDVERFIFNKLITGAFRVGVSQQLVVKALAKYTDVKENVLAHLLMGSWSPAVTTLKGLLHEMSGKPDYSKPYPFYLAYALDENVESLGDPSAWMAERKWDGIRGQIIVRNRQLFVWSRGEELVTDKYPEYHSLLQMIPDGTVMDGEIMPYKNDQPMAFAYLQKRIGRKNISAKILKDVPVAFIAYDVLEWQGEDIRSWPMTERRKKLEAICEASSEVLRLSPQIYFESWEQLTEARTHSRDFLSEGIMLKRKNSVYRNGRRRGDWWKWKIDPLTVDAVLLYAMPGSGRRANLYTDYTFAVFDGDQLVPFAKAYSGLTDEEILAVDRWVRKNTIERFGPVRSVKPELVFEIAFEGINLSTRHKSGIAVRFPRIHRWRKDKNVNEINTLNDLRQLVEAAK